MTKQELIDKALKNWTEGQYVRASLSIGKSGRDVEPKSSRAVKWCAVGILHRFGDSSLIGEIAKDFTNKYGQVLWLVSDHEGYQTVTDKLKHLYDN